MRYDDDHYADALADAYADAAADAYAERLAPYLNALVEPIMAEVEAVEEDQPHPWTYHRALLAIWLEEGDDALRDYLTEKHREQAEAEMEDDLREGPCCNDYHCPCGNRNNYRGF